MDTKKTALVIGTGAGGAVVARDLQGKYQVTMLEAGKEFQPFSFPVNKLAGLRRTGLFFDCEFFLSVTLNEWNQAEINEKQRKLAVFQTCSLCEIVIYLV